MNTYDNDTEEMNLHRMRHSASHIMAAAISELWPDAKFGVGPAIDNGFFYDVELAEPLKLEDLKRISKLMKKMKGRRLPFERVELPIDEAIEQMRGLGQDYKVELLELLKSKGSTAVAEEIEDPDAVAQGDEGDEGGVDSVTFYKVGKFVDLCKGPHIENTSDLKEFKLYNIAGAYWRGDTNRPQLQRIYGLAFNSKEELEHCEWEIEQRKLRDHRKIGKEMRLFTLSEDIGRGLPIWLPNGVALRSELEHLALEEERRQDYKRVVTPHIAKEALYVQSGHLPYYKEDMYAPMNIDDDVYYLKPMNCPFHHKVYSADPHSYHELPIRVGEYGVVYRYEASGAMSGLMRTRGFCQNDAHIYCREDQAKEEFLQVMRMHVKFYEIIGIKDYYMLLAKPDIKKLDKYIDQPEDWEKALDIIVEAMKESGFPYKEEEGEAAFYGPKIDFMIRSAIGTEYAISTNQLDFLATQRFDLTYVNKEGGDSPVYVIHRAPLGSHERFVAFLIEHYAGKFPVWLSPVQAMVIPITDRNNEYASDVRRKIFDSGIPTGTGGPRIEVDCGSERMQKKIRNAQIKNIPYMLVVGDKEQEDGTVAVRLRSGKDLGPIPLEDFLTRLRTEITDRKDTVEEE